MTICKDVQCKINPKKKNKTNIQDCVSVKLLQNFYNISKNKINPYSKLQIQTMFQVLLPLNNPKIRNWMYM